MRYSTMVPGTFIARPNRFIAYVEIDGREEIVHVKNTGRCRELLPPGARVWCQRSDNPNRKTKKTPPIRVVSFGGDNRTRTCDLMRVKHAL